MNVQRCSDVSVEPDLMLSRHGCLIYCFYLGGNKVNTHFVVLYTHSVLVMPFKEKKGFLTVLFTSSGRGASGCRCVVAFLWCGFVKLFQNQ